MATLIERIAASGCDIMLPREGEIEDADGHTRAFSRFRLPDAPDGRPRYRIGGGIGPTRYRLDPYSDERWRPIDMSLLPVKGEAWPLACETAGHQFRAYNELPVGRLGIIKRHYVGEFRRAGAWYRMAPLALYWQNNRTRRLVATPTAGIAPVTDETGSVWWPGAFGTGIDFGYLRTPDGCRKVLRLNRRPEKPALMSTDGLKLVMAMGISTGGAAPEAASLRDLWVPELPDAFTLTDAGVSVERPGRFAAIRADGREAYWLQDPEAWDAAEEPRRWQPGLTLERRGDYSLALVSVAYEDLIAAQYPLMVDAAISEEQVGAGSDDAYGYASNNWVLTNYYAMLNMSSNDYQTGHRFTSVPIPQGATIDSATLGFYIYIYDDPSVTLYCEDVDNADTFTTSDKWATFTLTTASVAWVASDIGTAWRTSPDVSSIVEEVIERGGWASGNALAFLTRRISSSQSCRIYTYETSASYGAKFNCTYTEAPPGLPMRLFMADFYRNAPGVEVF